MPKDDRVLLQHIADAIGRIHEFTDGVSDAAFRERRIVQSAVVRELEIIGEASRDLSDRFRAAHPEIDWATVIAMRNRLVHAYFDVDLTVVWEVVHQDLPKLDAVVESSPRP